MGDITPLLKKLMRAKRAMWLHQKMHAMHKEWNAHICRKDYDATMSVSGVHQWRYCRGLSSSTQEHYQGAQAEFENFD